MIIIFYRILTQERLRDLFIHGYKTIDYQKKSSFVMENLHVEKMKKWSRTQHL